LHAAFVVYLLLERERARENEQRAKHRELQTERVREKRLSRDKDIKQET